MPERAGLESCDRGTVLVLGVGNSMKGDDGVGPYVAVRLAKEGDLPGARTALDHPCRLLALDCGTVPENYTSVVRRVRPELLLIVDAADMGLAAGSCRVIPPERIGALGLSTHSMPLSLFMSYVKDLAPRAVLVGVQPGTMALGTELSPDVAAAADALVETIARGGWDAVPRLG